MKNWAVHLVDKLMRPPNWIDVRSSQALGASFPIRETYVQVVVMKEVGSIVAVYRLCLG